MRGAQKTLILQHTDMEVPGSLIGWHQSRGREFEVFKTYLDHKLPELNSFENLVVLGGPMNVDQEKSYPFLKAEKKYIDTFLNHSTGKYIGICLGAQLLARSLGVKVKRNPHIEIGWHGVHKVSDEHPAFKAWPEKSLVFQWHEDTFELPPGAKPLFRNEACENQGFSLGNRVVAFQFHPESTKDWIYLSLQDFKEEEHVNQPFVQKRTAIEAVTDIHLTKMQDNFFSFLDQFLSG